MTRLVPVPVVRKGWVMAYNLPVDLRTKKEKIEDEDREAHLDGCCDSYCIYCAFDKEEAEREDDK